MKLNLATLGIVLVIAFHVVGLLLFCKGYLLNRIVVSTHASCLSAQHASQQYRPGAAITCTGFPEQFRRVVWVIIDALRYDFSVYDETLDPVPLYRNKLPYIRDLLRDQPENARLYRFYADAPTTTLQRLKALSTGSLPTFIDFSLNFKGHEVSEDSLPHQMAANNKTVTFLGDDTWIGLYPRYFNTVMALPSFNVKDLHTVDNEVIKRLIPELKQRNADWVIGHFLGVDHCGHTFGPSHPAMAEKLQQMNENLKLIVEQLDSNTIMFVFGDHGMTRGGDHGGESYLETNAALFVYSHRPLFCNKQVKDTVSQIDLIPTMSLLMGVPIPYSSLGALIADVIQPCGGGDNAVMDYLTALASNAQQIHDYLQVYSTTSGGFPADEYRNLQQLFNRTVMQHRSLSHSYTVKGYLDAPTVNSTIEQYYQYMFAVKRMCVSVWAKFDDHFINQGLLVLLLGCIVNMCLLWSVQHSQEMVNVTSNVLTVTRRTAMFVLLFPLTGALLMQWDILGAICYSLFLTFIFISMMTVYSVRSQILFVVKQFIALLALLLFETSATLSTIMSSSRGYVDTVISSAVLICSSVALLSNSFIIHEGYVLTFFIQTLIAYEMFRDFVYCRRGSLELHRFLLYIILMICVRSSELFWICREEVIECRPTHFTFPFAMVRAELGPFWSLVRLAFSVVLVTAVPVCLLFWIWSDQKVWTCLSYWLKLLLLSMVPASLCICAFWIMQGFVSIKQLDEMPHWQHVTLPRIVYALCIATIVKCIHESYTVKLTDQETVRTYYVVMTTVAWVILVMLFHDGIAFAVGLLLVQSFLMIHLYHTSSSNYVGTTWSLVVVWYLMMVQLYYATGHQPTITGIKLEAGFVGQHGEMVGYKLVLAGLLVGINAFAAQILLPWMVPLFILWPYHGNRNGHKPFSISHIGISILKLLFCQTVKLFFSVLAASLHRRHLMVWAIFAPRFLYELAFVLIVDLVLMLSYLYTTSTSGRHPSTKIL